MKPTERACSYHALIQVRSPTTSSSSAAVSSSEKGFLILQTPSLKDLAATDDRLGGFRQKHWVAVCMPEEPRRTATHVQNAVMRRMFHGRFGIRYSRSYRQGRPVAQHPVPIRCCSIRNPYHIRTRRYFADPEPGAPQAFYLPSDRYVDKVFDHTRQVCNAVGRRRAEGGLYSFNQKPIIEPSAPKAQFLVPSSGPFLTWITQKAASRTTNVIVV
jgi:hypothetical protein